MPHNISYNCKVLFSGHISKDKKSKLLIGKKCNVMANTVIGVHDGAKIQIGDGVYLGRNVNLISHKFISIGEKTAIGPNTSIFDHDHDYKGNPAKYVCSDIVIGKNVWIGTGCIILKGTEIGDNCVIGAGTVLKGKIEPNSLVYNERSTTIKTIKRD